MESSFSSSTRRLSIWNVCNVITKNASTDTVFSLFCISVTISKRGTAPDNMYKHLKGELFLGCFSHAPFPRFKLPERETGHSHFAEYKNAWSFSSVLPYVFMQLCLILYLSLRDGRYPLLKEFLIGLRTLGG